MSFSFKPKDVDRFLTHVHLTDGPLDTQCWVWTGAKSRGQGNKQWYGTFKVGGRAVRAHKFGYVAIGKREWVEGNHLDHLCEVSLCVNPKHLDMVLPKDNPAGKKREFDPRH